MEKYDYLLAVRNDVKEYIEENINREDWQYPGARYDLQDKLYEDLWDEDSVTGNGSGSYTFNRWEAEENLCHNLDLLGEALEEFGCGPEYMMEKGPEACDVTVRCFVLGEAIDLMLECLERKNYFDMENEEQETPATLAQYLGQKLLL